MIEWNIVGIVLTTVATFGLVIIGFRQTQIQKTQTDIQNKALKISLLEQRIQCLNDINNVRSSFLVPREIVNRINFYNTGSGAYTISDIMKSQDSSISNYIKAIKNSKYLFSKEQHDYLHKTINDISNLLAINKELLFKSNFIVNLNNDENNAKKQKILVLKERAINNNEILEKELFEILQVDYQQYTETTNRLIENFSNEQFFASFDEYLDVGNI
jgi:hypothetical protein